MNTPVQRIQAAIDVYDWDAAQRELTVALGTAPDDPLLVFQQARVAFQLGRIRPGLLFARRAVELAPESADAHLRLSLNCQVAAFKAADDGDTDDYDDRMREAFRAISTAMDLAPERADILASSATLESFAGNFDDALVDAEDGLKLDPKSTACHEVYTLALWYTGRLISSVEAAKKLRELDPENEIAHGILSKAVDEGGVPAAQLFGNKLGLRSLN